MVVPSWLLRPSRIVALAAAALLPSGCSVVPGSRLDECHKMSRTLQADNSRLKDSVLGLKSQYEDLAQRADDDALRLKVQDEEVRRLTASVHAYQEDIEKVARLYEQLKAELRVSANPIPGAVSARFEAFAKSRPGCEFVPGDAEAVFTFATDHLFQPGTDRLTPEAETLLRSFADLLAAPEARDVALLVAGHVDSPAVRRAGLRGDGPESAHLSLDRAARVRDLLAREARIDPARIEAAGFESSRPRDDGPDETAHARNRRIEIHLRPAATAPAAANAAGP